MRRAARIALVGAAFLTSLAAFLVGYVRSAERSRAGTFEVPGLRAPVVIGWDSLAVPHIRAGNRHDLLFAQGYIHARDRLWQMELFRRVAEGRLSELFGEDLLETDRFLRTLGVWRATERSLAATDPASLAMLQAYSAGVNMYLATRQGALPPEFLALRVEPEPWTVRHSLAIEKLIAWDLSPYYATQNLARAAARLGPERARFLVPGHPDWGTTILQDSSPLVELAATVEVPAVPPPAAALLEALSIRRASNAWVIGGDRTGSGRPILANDMHLPLRAPGIWYLAALHGGGFDVAGMTIPGVPFVIAGHNDAVAWGFTNAMVDDLDIYVERVDPADPGRYLTPDGSAPFDTLRERIRVRGREQPVEIVVRRTRNGVVISDVVDQITSTLAGGSVSGGDAAADTVARVLSLRWASHEPSRSFRAFPAMNLARDAAEFREALRWFENPHQNVVFADSAGTIGYQMAGRVPVRGTGRPAPALPVPGWTGEWDWTARLPFEAHPAVPDTSAGYIVTANNRQTAGEIAERITSVWEPPFRAARIAQMIQQADRPDAADVHAMQLDVLDLHAARYVDRAAEAARAAGLDDVALALEQWDLRAAQDSREAPLYYAWYGELQRLLAEDLYGDPGWMPRAAVDAALEARSVPWRDDGGEAFAALTVEAMRRAAPVPGGRTWGEVHAMEIEHAMSSAGLLERLLGLDVGPASRGGSPTTVNVSQYLQGEFPVVSHYGASQRHVVDMADPDGAGGFILPAGQSGIPTSEHYDDQFEAWLEGGLWVLPLDSAAAARRFHSRMTLEPEAWERRVRVGVAGISVPVESWANE